MTAVRFNYRALNRALDEKRRSLGMTWHQVAQDVGGKAMSTHHLSSSTIKRTASGGPMEADGVLSMVRWLGLTFQDFTSGAPRVRSRVRTSAHEMRRFDSRSYYNALETERRSRGITWLKLASEISYNNTQSLKRLRKGGRMGVDQVVVLSAWLGKAPEDFTRVTVR